MSRVAVAISIYKNDNAKCVVASLESLVEQSYKKLDVFLQVDGFVTAEVKKVIELYQTRNNFHCEFYPENKGLAFQLNRAIERILDKDEFDYIARMDADDISFKSRIAEQVLFFEKNPEVAVLGSSIIEFDNKGNETLKLMPSEHADLTKNIIKRCPFNHPTVMFNMNVIGRADLAYDSNLKNTQDYYLWVDLLKKEYKFANLSKPLLKFRIDENFHARRGFKKAVNDFSSRIYAMKMLHIFSLSNILHTLLLFGLRLSPSFVKSFAYKRFR
ncbi:glycosyltransferase [Pseudoalteromonas sp. P1-8]|uniref:glycosyltransferase n=1 Tax=Pseudoalteromonas sp. P1-8 TaxID=1710353 RepID=UPI0006DC002F|nr:glycosyltransferase [Pseudoalteromonas sp. P1-8]KPV96910.1 putative glycosyltransferase EpsE [Pseudoalteromonas sp. P1-8]